MFKHEKHLLRPVRVDRPNPQYAALLVEQLGGPNGELTAGMQYIAQSFRVKDPEIKDLMLDIGAEELGHMEMVATAVNLLNGHSIDSQKVTSGNIEMHVLGGLSPMLINASGIPWSANCVSVTGDLAADLQSNMAAELRAKVVYEYLYRQINDSGVRDMIDFLLNREEAHNDLFRKAFERIQGTGAMKNFGTTYDSQMYINTSQPGRYFPNPNQPQPRH